MARKILKPDDPNLEADLQAWGYVPQSYRGDEYKAWFVERLPESLTIEGIFNCKRRERTDWLWSFCIFTGIDKNLVTMEVSTRGNFYKANLTIPAAAYEGCHTDFYTHLFLQSVTPLYRGAAHQPFNYDMALNKQDKVIAQLTQLLKEYGDIDAQRAAAVEALALKKATIEALCIGDNRELVFEGNTRNFADIGLSLHIANRTEVTEKEDFDLWKFAKEFPGVVTQWHISRTSVNALMKNPREGKRIKKHVAVDKKEVFEINKILKPSIK